MEKTILQVQDYIASNEDGLALNKLRSVFSIADSELVNDVILLRGRIHKLKSDVRRGFIDYDQEMKSYNRIKSSILSLVDELKNDPERFIKYERTDKQLDNSFKAKDKELLPLQVKDVLYNRIAYVKDKHLDIRAIWIDDFPTNNVYESQVLKSFGLSIDFVKSSQEAKKLKLKSTYELMLSDISRNGRCDEGLRFHRELVGKGVEIPTIFYTSRVDKKKGVPPFAFGIADMPNDLIHLVLDVIERRY